MSTSSLRDGDDFWIIEPNPAIHADLMPAAFVLHFHSWYRSSWYSTQ